MPIYERYLKDGRKVYDVRVRAHGKQHVRKGVRTKREAEGVERTLSRLKDKPYALAKDIRVSELAQTWLADIKIRREPATYYDYEIHVRMRIEPRFGSWFLSDLRPVKIQEFINSLADHPRTANKTLVCLKSMLTQAVVWGMIEQNPALGVRPIFDPHKEVAYLTVEEAGELLEVVEGRDYLLLLLTLVTGMRNSEIRALHWEDIQGREVRVWRTLKTPAARRVVMLPSSLAEMLSVERNGRSGYIFTDRGGNPLRPEYVTRGILYPALARAGIKKHITFHSLRHTCAAWMASAGVPTIFIQKQLGHTEPGFTLKQYGHLVPDQAGMISDNFWEKVIPKCYHKQDKQGDNVIKFPQVK